MVRALINAQAYIEALPSTGLRYRDRSIPIATETPPKAQGEYPKLNLSRPPGLAFHESQRSSGFLVSSAFQVSLIVEGSIM